MEQPFDIQKYMTQGVEQIVRDAVRTTLTNPRESLFMARFAAASRRADKLRAREEQEGLHVPPFLIASITSNCNLHCRGCYSRANHATKDCAPSHQLTDEQWLDIFRQAEELGISFILLAGGEPMIRRDILCAAGKIQNIFFPVFTNGTFMDEAYLDLLDRCRNLFPVMSIEGGRAETDERRGTGVYDRLLANMAALKQRNIIFGASVTVTTENLEQALSDAFLEDLASRGCIAVFFIEFVPVTEEAKHLAPGDKERAVLQSAIDRLRRERTEMLYISFPGDEKTSGGCLAAGRGFFHINSHGGAEPCPFSPYSDMNVCDVSLRAALESRLFRELVSRHLLEEDHAGGCVLFERRSQVEAILSNL